MITGTQLRMARAALNLGVRDLAAFARVSPATITRIEGGHPANAATLRTLTATLDMLGVTCSIGDTGTISVTLASRKVPEGEQEIIREILLEKREYALKMAQVEAKREGRERKSRVGQPESG